MRRRAHAQAADEVPRYRIRAVCEQTGVAASTLRAWEHRYGVPEPARSDARYRLYSDRDVALIRRMAALCDSGVRPAEASRLAMTEPGPRVAEPAPAALTQRLVDASATLDEVSLRGALDAAFAKRPPPAAYDEIVSPALVRIGALWASAAISVAHEHLATSLVRERLVARLRDTAPDGSAPTVLLASADEDQHDLGLLGFALHVASWGMRPIVLGARVPPTALAAALEQVQPRFVGVSFVTDLPRARAASLFASYASVLDGQRWIAGGPGVSGIATRARESGAIVATTIDEARRAALAAPGRVRARRR